jgi:hypothetical protein
MSFDVPDPFVPQWIEHGTQRMRTERPRLPSRSMEVDTCTVSYQDERADAFPIDTYLDGFSTMPIVESDPRPDGPVYQYRLTLEGLKSGTWREIGYEEDLPEESWDTINRNIYTSVPADRRWRKGARIELDAKTGVAGTASDEKFTLTNHGLVTGQLVLPDFSSGLSGLTSGGDYYVHRLSANQLYLCASKANAMVADITAPSAPVSITGVQSTNRIVWTAHGLSDDEVITFPTLTGGKGLTVNTPYYVINATTDDFQVATEIGGDPINFTTNISAGTGQKGTACTFTTDGTTALRPIPLGFEMCWITERRKRKSRALGYWEMDLQYKGLKLEDDDSKPFKRRISTTGQTVSNDNYNGQTISKLWLGFPPVEVGETNFSPPDLMGPPIAAEFDLPSISVTDTMVSTSAPPTQLVPGYWTPTDAPTITLFSPISETYTYHCPSGWKVLSMQSEQIPGKNLWLITITWGYQLFLTPRTTPAEA